RIGSVRLRHAGLADFTFLPDGRSLLTVGNDQMVRWWDLGTGRQTRARELPGEPRCRNLAVSPDGSMVAIPDSNKVTFWDTATGRTMRTRGSQHDVAECLTFHPDGSELAIGGARSRVTLLPRDSWEAREKEFGVRQINVPELRVGFSQNGRRMIVAN